jgi:hypothetical protein
MVADNTSTAVALYADRALRITAGRGGLVGTVTYQTYLAMIGVRLPAAMMQANDADAAQFADVATAVGVGGDIWARQGLATTVLPGTPWEFASEPVRSSVKCW